MASRDIHPLRQLCEQLDNCTSNTDRTEPRVPRVHTLANNTLCVKEYYSLCTVPLACHMLECTIQMMEHKSLCGVLKQLQGEGALRGVEAKGGAATMCSVITVTKTCIKQL